jgi:hypothetical protein
VLSVEKEKQRVYDEFLKKNMVSVKRMDSSNQKNNRQLVGFPLQRRNNNILMN